MSVNHNWPQEYAALDEKYAELDQRYKKLEATVAERDREIAELKQEIERLKSGKPQKPFQIKVQDSSTWGGGGRNVI